MSIDVQMTRMKKTGRRRITGPDLGLDFKSVFLPCHDNQPETSAGYKQLTVTVVKIENRSSVKVGVEESGCVDIGNTDQL